MQWSSHLKGGQTQSQDGTLAGMLHRDKDLAFLVTVGLQLIYLHGRWRETQPGFNKMAWAPTLDKYSIPFDMKRHDAADAVAIGLVSRRRPALLAAPWRWR